MHINTMQAKQYISYISVTLTVTLSVCTTKAVEILLLLMSVVLTIYMCNACSVCVHDNYYSLATPYAIC
jgi:hypothetical protein